MQQLWIIKIISYTYNCCRSWSQHTVEHKRWNEALVLRSRVWFHQIAILTEETLDMHLESIGALEVVGKQNSPSHDDKLKIKHDHIEALVAFFNRCSYAFKLLQSCRPSSLLCHPHSPCNSGVWVCVSVYLLCNICYINLLANDTNERLR